MNLVCVSGMADASASGGAGQVPTQRGERERSPTRTPTTQEQQQPAQGPQRFRMNSPEGGQGLPGGATAPYASIPPPPPKAASGCGSMPGSPTGQQEVFSTAQMTQIAQIVSLSLNQAMGEFNMRLNGLQQQVVHQQNVFAQAQVQQAASQPAQVPVAKTSPSISSGLSSFGDRPPTSPQPNFPRNTVEQPPGLQQSPQRLIRVLHRKLRVKRRHRMTGMSLLRVRSGFLHCPSVSMELGRHVNRRFWVLPAMFSL